MSPPTSPKPPSSSGSGSNSSSNITGLDLHPITLLSNPSSKPIALARPAAYLALLALRFNNLVADPVTELQYSLGVLALGQAVYAVACLPINGSEKVKPTVKRRPGERRKVEGVNGPRAIPTVILALVLSLLATPFIYLLLILFGAPFLASTPHTLLLASHFSLLAILPILYTRGVEPASLLAIAGCAAPLDEVFGGLLGAGLGAWAGAVPIPLDWDREWQRWPVTVLVGMYLGAGVGSLVGGSLLFGKKVFVASPEEEVKDVNEVKKVE